MDHGNLPSRRHLKTVRTNKPPSITPSYKAPKSKDAMAYLDGLAVNLVSSEVPSSDVQTEAIHPFVGRPPHKTHLSTLVKVPPILVLDEGHAFSLLIFKKKENF